jgi:hypothetical protein
VNDLDPKAQALLDSVRGADAPTRREKTRVKRRVLARVAGVMLAASAGTSAKTTAASVGAVAAGVWSAKLVVVTIAVSAIVAGGAATGVVVSHLRGSRRAVTTAPAAPTAPVPVAASAPVATSPRVPPMPEQLAAQPVAAPHPLAGRAATAPRRMPAASNETLEEELPLLQSAQDALRLGDTDRALGLLDVHAKKFPTGTLSEERRAAHALAACRKADGPSARAEAKAFVLDSPSSPLVESVRKACLLAEP